MNEWREFFIRLRIDDKTFKSLKLYLYIGITCYCVANNEKAKTNKKKVMIL